VNEFSPVAITGEVNGLSRVLYTDLAMNFRNMELSTFNPYSGKFAGYNITKGKNSPLNCITKSTAASSTPRPHQRDQLESA